ncbi:ADM_collapsed_G0022330.mRNA.1.CDS.1 [Saccharomyces cerevisiae]|nr:ADM_collapsed_G0022330.mRNA.1.CDS.1 [Saccharomyces cerevisiae]
MIQMAMVKLHREEVLQLSEGLLLLTRTLGNSVDLAEEVNLIDLSDDEGEEKRTVNTNNWKA